MTRSCLTIITLLLFCMSDLPAQDWDLTTGLSDPNATIVSQSNVEITLDFELTALEGREMVKESETYDSYLIPNEGVIISPGKPMLPAVSRFVIVPPQCGLELVASCGEVRRVVGRHSPVLYEDDAETDPQVSVYSYDTQLFPPVYAEISEPSIIRGVRVVKVTTYPVQYDHANNAYLHRQNIRTEIRYTEGEALNPVLQPNRRNRSPELYRHLESLVINPDQVRRDDLDVDREYIGHYAIASHPNAMEYIKPFIEWRRKSGYKVDILDISTSDASNSGRVKGKLRDLYEEYVDDGIDPFDYVLLVGDRQNYGHGPSPGWQLQADGGHQDYRYALLDGNDQHADVGVSRWPGGHRDRLELMVGRTLGYEATPHMEDTTWFTRGAAYSQHWGNTSTSAWHVSIATNVRWGYALLQHLGFDDVTFYEDYDWDQYASRIGPDITDMLNNQTNLMLGRAELYWFTSRPQNRHWSDFDDDVDANVVFPVEINTCGHGEWSRESMYRQGDADNLKGFVSTTFTWSGPPTLPNSGIWLEMVNGIVQRGMGYGWGFSHALTAFERHMIDYGGYSYTRMRNDVNAFSDPGLKPWLGVPKIVDTEVTELITPQTRMITSYVFDPDTEDPVEGAQVTLYIPGEMPEGDDDDYPSYDEMYMRTRKTPASGRLTFILDENVNLIRGTPVYITVTGKNASGRQLVPHFDEIEIENPDVNLEISGYTLEDNFGDDEVNPSDTLTLELFLTNFSNRDRADDVTAVVSSTSEWLEISENEIGFGDIDADDEAMGDISVDIIVSSFVPDGAAKPTTRPVVEVEISSGDQTWISGIELDPHAPNFIVERVIDGNVLGQGDERELDIEIRNAGRIRAEGVRARLQSQGLGVGVTVDEAWYNDIAVDRTSRVRNDPFAATGNTIVSPGSSFRMMLEIESNNGFVDSSYFYLYVGEPSEGTPQGPDPYGYVCYDDTDVEWEDFAPEFNWIEISREEDYDFRGIELDFDGSSEGDVGEAIVIDLDGDFVTQFYGHEYDKITVCTNGYICPGDQELSVNPQNWPLDEAFGGGAGMIAPYWDWLDFKENSGVYYYFDRDEHALIIEWYDLKHKSSSTDLTFQVILYDKRYWRSATGDPKIVFQYLEIEDEDGPGVEGLDAIKWASVGIASPDGNSGISYFWDDEYPVTSAPLESERALLFATSIQNFKSGYLDGYVTDVETDEPIDDAVVITDYGFTARTDSTGYWQILEALAEKEYNITARKQGYNDSTYVNEFIEDGDTMQIDFALLHPEFEPSTLLLSQSLDPGYEAELQLSIENPGNGPLDWIMERHLPRGADVDPWTYREGMMASDTVDNPRLNGVIFADGQFYVSARRLDDDAEHKIFILSDSGSYVDEFAQPDQDDNQGFADLAWDKDEEILWGASDQRIYGLTTEGEEVTTIDPDIGGRSSIQSLAWDEEREVLWISAIVSDIMSINSDGEITHRLSRLGLRLYGLAYWPDSPDEYKLFILHQSTGGPVEIFRMNPDTGDTVHTATLEHPDGLDLEKGGIFASNQFDVYSWVLMHVAGASSHDRLDIWQLDARKDWFKLYFGEDEEAEAGRVEAGESSNFSLILNSADLPAEVTFNGMLDFYYNAHPFETVIDVSLEVIGPREPSPFELLEPVDGDTINPVFEDSITFNWELSNDPNFEDIPVYQLWFEADDEFGYYDIPSEVNTFSTKLDSISDEVGISLDVETPITWWVMAISGLDSLESTSRFQFRLVPNSIENEEEIPVEFGLKSIYPSPFNSMTKIIYGIDAAVHTNIAVYDLLGRKIRDLFNGVAPVGYHNLTWNANDMPSGLYVVRIESDGRMRNSKVALIR